MRDLANLINSLIQLYIYVVIASAILSWLIAFDVLNTRNNFVHKIADLLYRLTEPALRPIRRYIPTFSGIDLSPFFLIIGLIVAQIIVRNVLA